MPVTTRAAPVRTSLPALLGILFAGTGTITIDPYTGLKTNTVRMRLEIQALLHVRSPAGAYVIA